MKHLLTLTDFSSLSAEAVKLAFDLAEKNKAQLTIYHYLYPGELVQIELDNDPDFVFDEEKEDQQKQLLTLWKQWADEKKIKVEYIVSSDHFIDRIHDIVKEREIDLIVMGTVSEYDRTDSRWYSNAQSVVKNVDCSVLVIKNTPPKAAFQKIVFASSFNENDQPILQHMLNLLGVDDRTELHLLSVDTSSYFTEPNSIVKIAMQDFKEKFNQYNVITRFYNDLSIDSGIRNYVAEVNPDLLVIGNHHKKPLKHMIQGNRALWNVAHIDCPVLTIDYPVEEMTS